MNQLEYLAKTILEGGGAMEQQALRDALRHLSDPTLLRVFAEKFYADPEVAIPAFERLLELQPSNVFLRVELGFVFFLMGEDVKARRQLELARALEPEHVQVLILEAALAREKTEKARLYRLILQKEPGNEIAMGKLRDLGETA